VTLLLAKLVLTPLLIGAVTLAGRRWGPGVSGWLAGLPLTSGPVSVFLALEQGPRFATRAALATLAGLTAVAAFSLSYAALAPRVGWGVATTSGLAAYLVLTAVLSGFRLGLLPTLFGVLLFLALVLRWLPAGGPGSSIPPLPWWDVPLRMLVATGLVLLLTGAAALLGPELSGLLSPFPVFATVLAGFTHRSAGSGAAQRLLRGVVIGSFAFAAFFILVSTGLPRWGVTGTYLLASAGALVVQALARRLVEPRGGLPPSTGSERAAT
jgi:hypothetical protein